jgi:hypothetical protein
MIECKIPLNVTLPDLEIPIFNTKGKKIGVAMQTKIRKGIFTFQPRIKGSYSRPGFNFELQYSPNIHQNKIESINLSVNLQM